MLNDAATVASSTTFIFTWVTLNRRHLTPSVVPITTLYTHRNQASELPAAGDKAPLDLDDDFEIVLKPTFLHVLPFFYFKVYLRT